MGATVSALEAAGMVVGEADPADGRRTILSLTRACRDLINANRAAREDWLFHALEAKLSADEQRDLTSALELLKRLAES
jgi:DNA-binding MarR family transcriptional regulator